MALRNTHFSSEEIEKILKNTKRIFFIGIGGVSMSSIATYMHYKGYEIYGCDNERTKRTEKLESIAKIKYYSTPDRVRDMDMVVYTSAIDENNFEYKMAKNLKIPTLSRANLLGYIISSHKKSIGISGTHGKSTTVSMLAKIFSYAGRSPTVFCGAYMKDFGGELLLGKSDVCIFEACEYMDSFLSLPAREIGLLNLEYDHPDYFKCFDDMKKSFITFSNIPDVVFLNVDDNNLPKIINRDFISYGIDKNADYRAILDENGFTVLHSEKRIAKCELKFKGTHFVYDALCAFAIAHQNNISPSVISQALKEFGGVKRRLEFIKKTDTSLPVFEDYAHHPTEIRATISSLLEMGYKRIFLAFQPHTYSRSFYLYDDFTKAFKGASELYFLPTFKAREKNTVMLDECKLATDSGGTLLNDLENLKERIKATDCDVIVLMGAGDITNFKNYL